MPLASTGPTPEMTIWVALLALQFSTTAEPGLVLCGGLAVKDVMVGGGGGCGVGSTVTVACAVTDPKLFVAVSV